MGKFQVFVSLTVVTCAIISTVQSVPVSDSSVESENAAKCKSLCGFCDCTGYYCGDECLCECNSQTDGEAKCVDTMKSNCMKLALPFEVLIQGPNINRMVRSLLYADPDEETCVKSSESNQKKRSTISIYKPDAIQQQVEILPAPRVEYQETHEDDSTVHVIVAQKSDAKVYPTKIEQVQDQATQTEVDLKNVDVKSTDSFKLPSMEDAVHRSNVKRHINDVNEDFSELNRYSDDSFLHKRETPVVEEKKDEKETKDESVAAPVPPAPPATTPFMPKFREAIENIKARIPTSDEIRDAWEGVRIELNGKINSAIAEAQKRAADLRSKVTPPPPPAPPAALTPLPPLPKSKFNSFLKSENEEKDVAMSLLPVVPVPVPVMPVVPIQAEIAKSMAASRAATLPIQAEMAKSMAAVTLPIQAEIFKTMEKIRNNNNAVINNFRKKTWFGPTLLGSTHEEEGDAKAEEAKPEEAKPEEAKPEEPVKNEEKKKE